MKEYFRYLLNDLDIQTVLIYIFTLMISQIDFVLVHLPKVFTMRIGITVSFIIQKVISRYKKYSYTIANSIRVNYYLALNLDRYLGKFFPLFVSPAYSHSILLRRHSIH